MFNDFSPFFRQIGVLVEIMACISLISRSQVQTLEDQMKSYVIGIVLASAMASALTVSTILLLIAAFKNDKPLLLMPWLVTFASTSVFLVAMLTYIAVFGIREGPVDMAAATIFGSLFLSGRIYLLYLKFVAILFFSLIYRFDLLLLFGSLQLLQTIAEESE